MEEKMDTQQREEQAAAIGAENIQEAVDAEIKKDAEEVVTSIVADAKDLPEGASLAPEITDEARIAQLKDELERLETGLPNAGATVQSIRDKQQKVPGRAPNTPDVNPGNVDEITAVEAEKYKGVLGQMPMMPGMMPGMGMPSMAAGVPAGPRGPVGHQGPVGVPPAGAAAEPPRPRPRPVPQETSSPQQASGPRSVQLDPRTLLEVELVSTKKRLAEANERLALVALSDARKAKQTAEQSEAALMAQITKHYGIPAGKNVRLIDKEKGVCLIED